MQMIINTQADNRINEALAWGDFLIGTKRKEECLPINPSFTLEMTVINF